MMRIGLLGAAWITPMAILEPAKALDHVQVIAIAARDPKRARAFAKEHQILSVENTYEDLLARKDIDLVYIALPVSLHKEWSTATLRAGKHVLCEKPLVQCADQARQLALVSKNSRRLLIEAFHYRHHPYFEDIIQIINSGELGRIRKIEGRLHVPVPARKGQIRHNPAMGGGALLDLGCYPVHMIRTLAAEEPVVTSAKAVLGPTGVDLQIKARLDFPSGIEGVIDCAMPQSGDISGHLKVEGDRGTLLAKSPIMPHFGGTLLIQTKAGQRKITADPRSTFLFQLDAVSRAIAGKVPPLPTLADSITNAVTLDAISSAAGL